MKRMRRFLLVATVLRVLVERNAVAFVGINYCPTTPLCFSETFLQATTLDSARIEKTKIAVDKLKKVLKREYLSFFNPMQREYYSEGVSFDDPMTSLSGVDAYQNNVDMLASRTLMGKFLFQDAGIVLHSVTGGEVNLDGNISDIITRWTLRVTVKVLPWAPTARFTGISVYEISAGGTEGVVVDHQTDYWDSINLQNGVDYVKVNKGTAIKDFLDQLKPDSGNAAAAGKELPYQLLRRGKDYEVRRYPAYNAVTISYDRRDEGYDKLATLTKGVDPFTPAIIDVRNDNTQKTMSWPLSFAPPGKSSPPSVPKSVTDITQQPMWKDSVISTIDSKVIAVGRYADASAEPVVRKAHTLLREALERDGISISATNNSVMFAQYDAIYTLGKRRGEVWIELEDGSHPWSD